MQNDIAIIRDGSAKLEELRSSLLSLNKNDLIARKEQIKKLAREHRDTLSNEDLDNNIAEVEALNSQIEEIENRENSINNEIAELEKEIKEAQERAEEKENKEKRNFMENNVMDKRSTLEYRQAFMNFVQRGENSDVLEYRADAATTTTTAATVIPTTVMNEIIKESKVSGNILSKVRQLNVKGGVKIPTISAVPTASWIDEDTVSDRKALTTSSVTFSYYGLEVRIAQTLLSEYTSIDAFEAEFAKLAVEAMVNAKEIAIVNGSGSGQPTGILKTSGVTTVTIKEAEFDYSHFVAAAGKLPTGYAAGAEWILAQGSWDKIVGLIDSNGQPVARVNYGLGATERSFLGYPVTIVDTDRIKDFDTATAGTDFFAILGNLNYYGLNSNGNLGIYKYRDEEKNQDVTKALEFVDGKVLQPKAFVILKKAN